MTMPTGSSTSEGMVSAEPAPARTADSARERAFPPALERRYTRDGDRLLFPDGAPAIQDRGTRLVARTDNAQVARDLVEIAHARGWGRIAVRGTEPFRAEVARAAVRRGIDVTDGPRANAARTEDTPDAQPAPVAADASSGKRRPARRVGDLMTGEFVEAGKAPYRFEPKNTMSFYVRVATARGTRDLWGTYLREALTDSWTFPQPGDRIGVQFLGTQSLPRDGDAPGSEPRRRNLWRIEKASFFEARQRDAASLRAGGPDMSQPDSMSPDARQLAAILRAANVFASSRISRSEDRERFVKAVRGTLASTLEAGGRLPEVRLRERERTAARPPEPGQGTPDIVRTR
jgi:putative DNA primase/helicase